MYEPPQQPPTAPLQPGAAYGYGYGPVGPQDAPLAHTQPMAPAPTYTQPMPPPLAYAQPQDQVSAPPWTVVNVYQQAPVVYQQAPVVMVPPSVVITKQGPGFLLRAAWYLFIGWWLSGVLMFAAGFCIASVVLLPIGLAMVNRLPAVMTLRPGTQRAITTVHANGTVGLHLAGAQQRSMLVRSVYFLLVGWWLALSVMWLAWAIGLTLIGLPLSLWILNRLPEMTTLRRN